MKRFCQLSVIILQLIIVLPANLSAQQIVSAKQFPNSFSVINAVIYVDLNDFVLVKKTAVLLQQDIELVTGKKVAIVNSLDKLYKNIIAIGSIEKSSLLKELISKRKLNVNTIKNKWEAFQISGMQNPFNQVENVLAIAGSDRRGTAFGVFELSKQMGVSPWYWWADVPVKKQSNIYINTAAKITDAPKVKYRGFFINDEAPCLSNWSKEKFGGFNHLFYEKVFELLLRMKANYLWPAMWGNAFNTD
ncbi:MAG: glycosyl hydrolase 115 family protein, partial [Chitinophagaceae bacterium]